MTRLSLLALSALLLLAGTAHAGTVDVREGRSAGTGSRVPVAVFQANPGEVNDVTIVGFEATTIRITDSGAPITAGDGCTQVDANTAECVKPANPKPGDYPWLHDAELHLGDGDDELHGGPNRVGITADGGPGDDLLEGSQIIADELDGGGGIDRLVGGDGDDRLTDGDDPAAPGPDVLDGGPGSDQVSYATRTAAVTLRLSPGTTTGGQPGEDDTLTSIEDAIGGKGDDELEGTSGPNALRGGFGRDHLDGLAGDDALHGDIGNDEVHGGAGGDLVDGGLGNDDTRGDKGDDVLTGNRWHDTISCGPGDDLLADPTTYVVVPRDCEAMRFSWQRGESSLTLDPRPERRAGGRLHFTLGCPMEEEMDGLCPIDARGRLTIRAVKRTSPTLGTSRLHWTLDRRDDPVLTGDTLQLNATGRRLAGRRGGVKAQIELKVDGLPTMGWTLAHLRARR